MANQARRWNGFSRIGLPKPSPKLAFPVLLTVMYIFSLGIFLLSATEPGEKWKLTVLHAFTNIPDGAFPQDGFLVHDKKGNLYGTTAGGGKHGCNAGCGAVFKVGANGKETVLYRFTGGVDGGWPSEGGLVRDEAGRLYGTTEEGGDSGYGTVFKVDRNGKETVLYSFTGGSDEAGPVRSLIRDAQGNLYGTTTGGGSYGYGTAFKIDTRGTETVLHSFAGYPTDGDRPFSGLVGDSGNNLYGTTEWGGASGLGTVFKLDSTGHETILHSFTCCTDGEFPTAGLTWDGNGSLCGTTYGGGDSGEGTVFRLDTTGMETILHSFVGHDGESPEGGLVRDRKGNFYGTAQWGGTSDGGTIFKLDARGKLVVLHSLDPTTDGAQPYGRVILVNGTLYGTTGVGGAGSVGTVFKLTPSKE